MILWRAPRKTWRRFASLSGLRTLDALASRYGVLPHTLLGDDLGADPYVRYCFDEAVALAGLGLAPPPRDTSPPPQPEARMGVTAEGVPFISGRVMVQKKTR